MPDFSPELKSAIEKAVAGGLGYVWLVILAIWGGTANYVSRIRKQKIPFSFIELIGEWSVSGFVGIITAYMCYEMGWSFYATAAVTGIAGHMGGRAIGILEHWLMDKIGYDKIRRPRD